MSNSMNLRDKVRSLTVASKKNFKRKLFSFTQEGETVEVEFRELTRKKLSELMKAATDKKTEKMDADKFMYLAIIEMTYVPGTDGKVFEEADIDSFQAQPASKENFINLFSEEINKLVGNDTAEQAEKNLQKTEDAV